MKKLVLFELSTTPMVGCSNKQSSKNETSENGINKKHEPLIDAIFPKPKVDIKTVGILLYENCDVLDAMGPYSVFTNMIGVKVLFVGRKKGMITTGNDMKIYCDKSIEDVKQLDILLIPGGLNESYLATTDIVLLDWIKAIDKTSKYTTSVCTGAWILGATGLLEGKDATTHWYAKKLLADKFDVNVVNQRYVKSGKYWTSAGVSAGIDMSLAIVQDIMGDNYTKYVMLDLEYDPKPPINGGTEHNTDKEIVERLRGKYDSALLPFIEEIDNNK